MAHTIELDPAIEQALIRQSALTGETPDDIIKNAVRDFLDEQDDIQAANAAYERYRAGQESTVTLEAMEQRLGLED